MAYKSWLTKIVFHWFADNNKFHLVSPIFHQLLLSPISHLSLLICSFLSFVSYLLFLIFRFLSFVSYLLFLISCFLSFVSYLSFPIFCFLSYVSYLTFLILRFLSFVSCLSITIGLLRLLNINDMFNRICKSFDRLLTSAIKVNTVVLTKHNNNLFCLLIKGTDSLLPNYD